MDEIPEKESRSLEVRLEQARSNPLPEGVSRWMSKGQMIRTEGATQGYAALKTEDELRGALKWCKTHFPAITDEWIEKMVEHERQHLDEARAQYAGVEGVDYGYAVQFLKMDDGSNGVVPMYRVRVPYVRPGADRAIRSAPEYHSSGDKELL